MKKFASRALALIIALSMLLIPTAFAAERNAANLSIGNFDITIGENTITLPVTLSIGGGVLEAILMLTEVLRHDG